MADKDFIEIPLTKGMITWISPEDADIAGWGWYAKQAGSKKYPAYYAMYSSSMGGIKTEYYLQDLVWSRAFDADVPNGFLVDHVNGDKLDNRRTNLRLATKSQNEQNKRKRRSNTTSRYKGVVKMTNRKKCWRATLTMEGYNLHLGTFYTEEEAAIAYNEAAYKHFGEFALLNEIDKPISSEKKEPQDSDELAFYKKRYYRKKHGKPRKDPNILQKDIRLGIPRGRKAVLPRTKVADKKARYREKLRLQREKANGRTEV